MSDKNKSKSKAKTSRWLIALTVIVMLPVFDFPWLLETNAGGEESRALLWFYPVYVIVSGICALICWRERPEVSWILLILMILSHIAMWML